MSGQQRQIWEDDHFPLFPGLLSYCPDDAADHQGQDARSPFLQHFETSHLFQLLDRLKEFLSCFPVHYTGVDGVYLEVFYSQAPTLETGEELEYPGQIHAGLR